jgi:multicomponent Na+:H+ antiporter subunit C
MTAATLFSACGAVLIAIGVFGLVARAHLLRRVLALNIAGSGVFLLFGGLGYRQPELGADPVPQAIVITGIIVALAATALAITLTVRLFEETGRATLPDEGSGEGSKDAGRGD